MFRTLLPGLLLTALLAGCAGGEDPDEVIVEDVIALGMGGCREHFAVLPVPMDAAVAALPDGFAPVPFDDAGLFATEFVMAYNCANMTGAAEGSDVAELTGGLFVVPPEGYTDGAISDYAFTYGFFTSSQEAADVYASWGFWASVGQVSVEAPVGTPAAVVGRAAGGDANLTVRIETVVQAADPASAGVARVFSLVDGNLSAADFTWTESPQLAGHAVVTLETPEPLVYIPPAGAGFGFHYAAESYGYTVTPVDLAAAGDGPVEGGIRGL